MTQLIAIIQAHWSSILLVLYFVFMAFVDSLEEPTATDGRGYRMLYKFCHAISFNFSRLRGIPAPASNPKQTP